MVCKRKIGSKTLIPICVIEGTGELPFFSTWGSSLPPHCYALTQQMGHLYLTEPLKRVSNRKVLFYHIYNLEGAHRYYTLLNQIIIEI